MIIQLTDSSLAEDLTSFLQGCPCTVQRVGATGLLVGLAREREEADARGDPRRCYRCGKELEAPLRRLGSLRCLDCRAGLADDAARDSAETQIRAFLRLWQALHPEAHANLRLVA